MRIHDRSLRLPLLLVAAALVVALGVPPAMAQTKKVGTVTVPGVNGGAPIAILAYEVGVEVPPPAAGGGGGTAKATFGSFRVVKAVDAVSPALLDLLVTAGVLAQVEIVIPLGGRGASATYLLTNGVVVASTTRRPAEKGNPPLEEIGFRYGRIRETVTTSAGTTTACWNVTGDACP